MTATTAIILTSNIATPFPSSQCDYQKYRKIAACRNARIAQGCCSGFTVPIGTIPHMPRWGVRLRARSHLCKKLYRKIVLCRNAPIARGCWRGFIVPLGTTNVPSGTFSHMSCAGRESAGEVTSAKVLP
jgi:hypothetical protein